MKQKYEQEIEIDMNSNSMYDGKIIFIILGIILKKEFELKVDYF